MDSPSLFSLEIIIHEQVKLVRLIITGNCPSFSIFDDFIQIAILHFCTLKRTSAIFCFGGCITSRVSLCSKGILLLANSNHLLYQDALSLHQDVPFDCSASDYSCTYWKISQSSHVFQILLMPLGWNRCKSSIYQSLEHIFHSLFSTYTLWREDSRSPCCYLTFSVWYNKLKLTPKKILDERPCYTILYALLTHVVGACCKDKNYFV